MMWNTDDGIGWGMMVFGMFMMVIFWGTIIALVVWGVRAATREDRRRDETAFRPSVPQAGEIAKERLARGEIDRDEFERIMSALEQHRPTHVGI